MDAQQLVEAFRSITPGSATDAMRAIGFADNRRDFLAIGQDGEPIFLIEDGPSDVHVPRRELRHVAIEFGVTCRVNAASETVTAQFVMVRCDPTVPELYELFIKGCYAWIADLPMAASTSEIGARLNACLELFRALGDASSKSIGGLWAELWLINRSKNTAAAIGAWHRSAQEKFDFGTPSARIEVKATQRSERIHDIGLDQLADDESRPGLLVSILLQEATGGTSLLELAGQIEGKLFGRSDLQQYLWHGVAQALGSDFSKKLDVRFDEQVAQRQAVVYRFVDIPRPPPITDSRVTAVRYRANLASVVSSYGASLDQALDQVFR